MPAQLKKIEIKYFKSFADLIIIDDLKRFNVVIGPNGSGKSNFMEAVAFCFGESSSRTRPTNIENLINSSLERTDRECYVASTFEHDEKELTFKRAIKGNRSLFSINDTRVDKNAYQNKLRQIGINTKTRYFIIYQGEEIELVMENPKQRTARFEEITGSIEYKEEYDHLQEEIDKKIRQLQDLKNQKVMVAKKRSNQISFVAKEAALLHLKDDYEKTEAKFYLIQLYITEEKMKASIEDRMLLEQTKRKLIEKRKSTKEDFSKKKKEFCSKHKQLNDVENQISVTKDMFKDFEKKLLDTKNKMENIEQKIYNSKKLLKKAKEIDESHKRNIDQLKKEYREVEELQNDISKQLSQELDKEHCSQKEEEYNALKKEISSKTSYSTIQLNALKNEQKELLTNLKKNKKKITEMNNKKKEVDSLLAAHEKCLKQYETIKHELEKLTKTEQEKKVMIKSYQKEEEEIERELKNIQEQLHLSKSNSINFNKSNAKIAMMKRLKETITKGVYGYLGELCQPIHDRYKIALATVLGKLSSAIIVDTRQTANSCFQLIKAERLGRTRILPLDALKTPPLQNTLRDIRTYEGVQNVKLLIDVAKYSEEIRIAVLYALKDTLVCENTEDAIHVAYELRSKKTYNCIALDGIHYRQNGVMSRMRHSIGRDTVSANIPDKSALKEKYEQLLTRLNDTKEQRKELNLNQIGGQSKIKITSMEKMIAMIGEVNANNEERIKREESFESQFTTLLNEEKEIQQQLKDLEEKTKKIEEKKNSIENPTYREFYRRHNIKNINRFHNSIEKLANLRSKKNKYERQLGIIKEILDNEIKTDTKSNIEKYLKKIDNLQQQLQKEKDKYTEVQKEENAYKIKLESLQKLYNEINNEVIQLKEETGKVEKLLLKIHRDFQNNVNSFKRYSSLYKQKLQEFKELLLKAQGRNVNLPFIQGSYDSMEDLETSDKYDDISITELHSGRSGMNVELDYNIIEYEINNDNIDDLQLMQKKFKTQLAKLDEEICKNDLIREGSQELTAINETLNTIIKQIDQAKADILDNQHRFEIIKKKRFDKFTEGFNTISESVKKIYKNLSGNENAQAFLEALNPTEPYLGDIQYFCIPPGKRFVHCRDLSGGEKTIAMLSLVFSILQANSSSILLLDEIDAPLDKIHFQNIIKYFNKLKESHQIIYITLNKKIMEHAIGLIGIHSEKLSDSKKSRVFTLDLDSS